MFEKIKDNKKSTIYESNEYIAKISEINGFFFKKNDSDYIDYDHELDPDGHKFVEAVKLEVTNKKNGKVSSKRCYQGFSVINDLEDDIRRGKQKFKTIFEKID